jgi:hypothetical protein
LVLVTSRSGLPGLVARDGARRLDLSRLDSEEALELLVALLGRARVEDEPEAAAELVRLCGGLPLALRVAAERATRLAGASLTGLVAELADVTRRLDVLDGGDPLADVRAVFSWSYQALDDSTARLFRLLAWHPGPDIERYGVANLADVALPQADGLLSRLADAYLVEPSTDGRYSMHDLLRAYAGELAAEESRTERHPALTRLFDWQLSTASTAEGLINPGKRRGITDEPSAPVQPGPRLEGPDSATAWLEAERACLVDAVRCAADHWPNHAWMLTVC